MFLYATGSKLNKDKSGCMFFGKWDSVPKIDVCVKTDCIKLLGLKIDTAGSGQQNGVDVCSKVSQRFLIGRCVTFFGQPKVRG